MDAIASVLDVASSLVDRMSEGLATQLEKDGRLSRGLLDAHQPQAFVLARLLSEREAASAMQAWAAGAGEYEKGLCAVYVARYIQHLQAELFAASEEFRLSDADVSLLDEYAGFVRESLSTKHLGELAKMLGERSSEPGGAYSLSADHREFRELFGRFADERVAPLAEEIHRHDLLIPEDLLQELADLGVFGISIPEEYGGSFVDHLTMCIATEELSRGSLGAGGSVITRPEICAKALLKGGSDEQKRKWLPEIASARRVVSVAVTEPNAGSDVAGVRVAAKKVDGGYRISGEKTWCTFAGRADVFILLARTGSTEDGHRGLTLFLAEKPPTGAGPDEHTFRYEQPEHGGTVEGHAIPTIGYRGMHSYTVTFDEYFVPTENRVGDEGKGFVLQMQGFAGGRIQTASRAVGVMEAALRKAVEYGQERTVFGKALTEYSLTGAKLVEMAAHVQASRQLSYHVARLMDEGKGSMEASLVKLLACKDAEWVTREAMQLHGGMGYSEEYAVSRYWQDARVLSIFEGAEEILALYVVARQHLRGVLEAR